MQRGCELPAEARIRRVERGEAFAYKILICDVVEEVGGSGWG